MMRWMRARIGKAGAVMAFLALLFAMAPGLESMACASEGCGITCLEQAEGAAASDASTTNSDDCAEGHCICAASHCSHAAIPAPEAVAEAVTLRHTSAIPLATQRFVSSTPQTPERPPRA